ncbi:hypothetical protein [Streptomyces sp. NBC_00448]|uniref:hypothetical protein n=1 Tax=Streptomyces sp. NBC_00448 TaxID=2903652 RepID=UPI002E2044C4
MADPESNAPLSASPLPDGTPYSGVIHVRHRHTENFTVIGNHLAQHTGLSALAIGLGVYILSLPDGAPVTVKALTARFPEGEITIRRALNELVATGYLERRRFLIGGGRFASRTIAYDRPEPGHPWPPRPPEPDGGGGPSGGGGGGGIRPEGPARTSTARPTPIPAEEPALAPARGPAADLLARLRLADPRLLLPARDIARLVPAVDTWLERLADPDQVARALTSGLPHGPIHHPGRFLAHRLTALLPPPLPPSPLPTGRPAPLHTCDGCDRAFRTHDPTTRCADCRPTPPPAPATKRAA